MARKKANKTEDFIDDVADYQDPAEETDDILSDYDFLRQKQEKQASMGTTLVSYIFQFVAYPCEEAATTTKKRANTLLHVCPPKRNCMKRITS